MGHTDVVTVDPKKWGRSCRSAATSDGGCSTGARSMDDKPHVAAGLIGSCFELNRLNVPLDHDVIFLAGGERRREHGPHAGWH